MKLTKSRPKTELQLIRESVLDYDNIPLNAEYDTLGNIINIETDNVQLQNALKSKGFRER